MSNRYTVKNGGIRNSDIYPEGMAPRYDFTPDKKPLAERIRKSASKYVSIDKDGNVRDYTTSYQGVGEKTKYDTDWVTGEDIYTDVMTQRGENQGFFDKIVRGTAKAGLYAGTSFIRNTAGVFNALSDIMFTLELNSMHNNYVNEGARALEQWAEDIMPLYTSHNEEHGNFMRQTLGSTNWWMELMKSTGIMLGSLGAGKIIGSAFGLLCRDLVGNTAPLVSNFLTATLSASGEASMEAQEIRETYEREQRSILDANYANRLHSINSTYAANTPEYTRALNQLNKEYSQSLDTIKNESLKAGNMTWGMNIPIIMLENMFFFGKAIGRSFTKTRGMQRQAADTVKAKVKGSLGRYRAAGTNPAGIILKDTAGILGEAAEEMAQNYVKKATEMYYLNSQLLDPDAEATETYGNFLNANWQAFKETLTDKEAWKEGLAGAVMGGAGIIGFRTPYNNQTKKFQNPFMSDNSIINRYRQSKASRKASQKLADELNATSEGYDNFSIRQALQDTAAHDAANSIYDAALENYDEQGNLKENIEQDDQERATIAKYQKAVDDLRIPTDDNSAVLGTSDYYKKFLNKHQELARILQYRTDQEEALAERDVFKFKNAEFAELFAHINLYAKAGRLNDLKEMITTILNPDDATVVNDIVNSTTSTKPGNTDQAQGPYINSDGNVMNMDDIKQQMIDNRDYMLQEIDKYSNYIESIRLMSNMHHAVPMSDRQVEELAYMNMAMDNMIGRATSLLNTLYDNLQLLYTETENVTSDYEKGDEYPERSPEHDVYKKAQEHIVQLKKQIAFRAGIDIRELYNNLVPIFNELDKQLMLSLNKEAMMSTAERVNDLEALVIAINEYNTRFNRYMSSPEVMQQESIDNNVKKKEQKQAKARERLQQDIDSVLADDNSTIGQVVGAIDNYGTAVKEETGDEYFNAYDSFEGKYNNNLKFKEARKVHNIVEDLKEAVDTLSYDKFQTEISAERFNELKDIVKKVIEEFQYKVIDGERAFAVPSNIYKNSNVLLMNVESQEELYLAGLLIDNAIAFRHNNKTKSTVNEKTSAPQSNTETTESTTPPIAEEPAPTQQQISPEANTSTPEQVVEEDTQLQPDEIVIQDETDNSKNIEDSTPDNKTEEEVVEKIIESSEQSLRQEQESIEASTTKDTQTFYKSQVSKYDNKQLADIQNKGHLTRPSLVNSPYVQLMYTDNYIDQAYINSGNISPEDSVYYYINERFEQSVEQGNVYPIGITKDKYTPTVFMGVKDTKGNMHGVGVLPAFDKFQPSANILYNDILKELTSKEATDGLKISTVTSDVYRIIPGDIIYDLEAEQSLDKALDKDSKGILLLGYNEELINSLGMEVINAPSLAQNYYKYPIYYKQLSSGKYFGIPNRVPTINTMKDVTTHLKSDIKVLWKDPTKKKSSNTLIPLSELTKNIAIAVTDLVEGNNGDIYWSENIGTQVAELFVSLAKAAFKLPTGYVYTIRYNAEGNAKYYTNPDTLTVSVKKLTIVKNANGSTSKQFEYVNQRRIDPMHAIKGASHILNELCGLLVSIPEGTLYKNGKPRMSNIVHSNINENIINNNPIESLTPLVTVNSTNLEELNAQVYVNIPQQYQNREIPKLVETTPEQVQQEEAKQVVKDITKARKKGVSGIKKNTPTTPSIQLDLFASTPKETTPALTREARDKVNQEQTNLMNMYYGGDSAFDMINVTNLDDIEGNHWGKTNDIEDIHKTRVEIFQSKDTSSSKLNKEMSQLEQIFNAKQELTEDERIEGLSTVKQLLNKAGLRVEPMTELDSNGTPLTNSDSIVYGYVAKDGTIYINEDTATAETPIHEYTHLWVHSLRTVNPEKWSSIVESLRQESDIWEYIQDLYPELTSDDKIAEEVLAHLSGKRGLQRLYQDMRESVQQQDYKNMSFMRRVITNLTNALKTFWNSIRDMFADDYHVYNDTVDVIDGIYDDIINTVGIDNMANITTISNHKEHVTSNDSDFSTLLTLMQNAQQLATVPENVAHILNTDITVSNIKNIPLLKEASSVLKRFTKRNSESIDRSLSKNPEYTDLDKKVLKQYLLDYEPSQQLALAKWLGNGSIRINEDYLLCKEAFKEAAKHKKDCLQYNSPGELLNEIRQQYKEERESQEDKQPKRKYLSPEDSRFAGIFTDKVYYEEIGVTVYTVRDDKTGQQAVRELMNDHLTENGRYYNCWCLLYANENTGELTTSSYDAWRHYSATEKKIAINSEGSICAFYAHNSPKGAWWDLNDRAHAQNIPILLSVSNDPLHRKTVGIFDAETKNIVYGNILYVGEKVNGDYSEWRLRKGCTKDNLNNYFKSRDAHYEHKNLHGAYYEYHEDGSYTKTVYKKGIIVEEHIVVADVYDLRIHDVGKNTELSICTKNDIVVRIQSDDITMYTKGNNKELTTASMIGNTAVYRTYVEGRMSILALYNSDGYRIEIFYNKDGSIRSILFNNAQFRYSYFSNINELKCTVSDAVIRCNVDENFNVIPNTLSYKYLSNRSRPALTSKATVETSDADQLALLNKLKSVTSLLFNNYNKIINNYDITDQDINQVTKCGL